MAPTFPLGLPSVGYDLCEFSLERQVVGARLRSGAAQRITRGTPYWRVTYRTVRLNRTQWQQVVGGFIEPLNFGVNTFLAHDVNQAFPISYPDGFGGLTRNPAGPSGGGAFDGTANLNAIVADRITVDDLPDNFLIKSGDLVGLVEGTNYWLGRAQEDRTSGINGTIGNFFLSPPPLPDVFTTAAVVHFEQPKALMRLDPETVPAPWTGPGSGPIIFSASQKVL